MPFQKNNKEGAKGKRSAAVEEVKALNTERVSLTLGTILEGTRKKAVSLRDDESASIITRMSATVALQGLAGDLNSLNLILDRTIGKVPIRAEAEITTNYHDVIMKFLETDK